MKIEKKRDWAGSNLQAYKTKILKSNMLSICAKLLAQ